MVEDSQKADQQKELDYIDEMFNGHKAVKSQKDAKKKDDDPKKLSSSQKAEELPKKAEE